MHGIVKLGLLAAMASSALAAHSTVCSIYSTTVEWWDPSTPSPTICVQSDSPLCPDYDCEGAPTTCPAGYGLFTPPMPQPTIGVTSVTGKDCSVTVGVDLAWATCGCTTCPVCATTIYHRG